MKKAIMFLCLLLLPFISLNAKIDSEEVDYTVEGLYINGQIEIAGAVNFREIIKVQGTFNGYERDLIYKNNNVSNFTGKEEDFKGSSIYNADSIIINKVGILQVKDFKYENFTQEYIDKNVKFFSEGYGKYELSSLDGGTRVRIYNETYDDATYFYIDYTVTNLIVKHNDCAEFYYNIIGEDFDDQINEIIAVIYLPDKDENMKLWAHGPLNGEAYSIEGGYGAILKINDLSRNVPVDLRMIYSTNLFPISINKHKETNMDALPYILEVEENRAEEANKDRESARFKYYTFITVDTLYLISLIGLFVYTYIKYDKEYKSSFNNEYYREFIDDYDVEVVDYLMKKYITENAFSASILNLIYKKKISVTKINESKDDYLFTLNNIENISESENKIVELLFKKIGINGKEVKMSEIKKASKEVYNKTHNIIYDNYNEWKNIVERKAKEYNFYMNNWKTKLLLVLYGLFGIGLFAVSVNIGMTILPIIILFISIIFILYSVMFSKKTVKGNEDYKKWKAFKKFLLDFGRFNEKELPEIILWERYLVYATVLGIADKVSKVMKVKFEQMNVNDTSFNHTFYNMYIFNSMSRDISRSINTSISNSISTVSAANSKNSSGGGFGGGFSGGGGFGGGGGGGRGF